VDRGQGSKAVVEKKETD